jgi:hypothetical protein
LIRNKPKSRRKRKRKKKKKKGNVQKRSLILQKKLRLIKNQPRKEKARSPRALLKNVDMN